MLESSGDVLFLRVPPPGLLRRSACPWGRTLGSLLRPNGVSGQVGTRRLTCFWIGFGRRVRLPGPRLFRRLEQGTLRLVVDIGCAGALDPSLRRGDLVLSSAAVPFDGQGPLPVARSPETGSIARQVAEARGVALAVAPVLTHERAVLSREARLGLFESTGCAAVEMEHAWFLGLLKERLPKRTFEALRFTHLVLITDAVPGALGDTSGRSSGLQPGASRRPGPACRHARRQTRRQTRGAAWDAVRGYLLPGRGGILSLRREFLTRWLVG
ncbi:MAG: hypothetical protein JW820_18125 [Spirochaetales bacterium]|nr:hypothetical protein [Spirochaetales bacterium]